MEEAALVTYSFPQIWTLGSDASIVIIRDRSISRAQNLFEFWQSKRGKEARPVPSHQEGREARATRREWESEMFSQYCVLIGRPGDELSLLWTHEDIQCPPSSLLRCGFY